MISAPNDSLKLRDDDDDDDDDDDQGQSTLFAGTYHADSHDAPS